MIGGNGRHQLVGSRRAAAVIAVASVVGVGVMLAGGAAGAAPAAVSSSLSLQLPPAQVPIGAPGVPTDLRATVHGDVVVLHWRAPRATVPHGTPSDYLVIWSAPPIEPITALADTHSTATTYRSAFGPGTYQVVAKNAAGLSPPSAPVVVGGP